MTDAVEDLISLLDLEQIELNLYRGHSPETSWQRVFGGQVIGQALMAAYKTVDEGRICHSLHAYFIRPGDPKVPILYEVDRARDGRSFTTRRVVAIQHGKQIFNLAASFQVEEKGFEHQLNMPDVPAPEDLPTERERREAIIDKLPEAVRTHFTRPRPIEMRAVDPQQYIDPEPARPGIQSLVPRNEPDARRHCHAAMCACVCLRHDLARYMHSSARGELDVRQIAVSKS